jgi:hypothetical protein
MGRVNGNAMALTLSRIHHSRFLRTRIGKTAAEIAAEDKVSEETVLKSIRLVDQYRASHTLEDLNIEMIDVVLDSKEETKIALKEALTAKSVVETKPDGTVVTEPDHGIRMRAVENWTAIAVAQQPKSPKVQVNTQVNTGQQSHFGASRPAGFEERLREIRKELDSTAALPQSTSVIPAQVLEIEPDEDDEESDEEE